MDAQSIVYVYTPWITIKGRKIFRKNGKVFKFPDTRGRETAQTQKDDQVVLENDRL